MNTNTTNELTNQAPGNPFAVQAPASGGALAAMTSNAAVTSVLASIWIAKQFPRDLAEVTLRMKQACAQPKLAQSATYSYPRGNTTVTGPSIRLAEALIGAWGNAEAGWKEVARHWDPKGADGNGCNVSECLAYCFDKETNVRREIAFSVPHTRDKNETDSKGKKTGKMLRVALDNERDVYELCANMASRRIRACILQVLPGWRPCDEVHHEPYGPGTASQEPKCGECFCQRKQGGRGFLWLRSDSDACPRHPDLGDGFHRQQRKRPDFHHGHFPLGQARAEEGCQQEEQIKQRKEP